MACKYLTNDTIRAFFQVVQDMRKSQKFYFQSKAKSELDRAIRLEKTCDKFIAEINTIEGTE